MIPFLAPLMASKLGKPLVIGGGIILLLGAVFLLGRCTGGNDDVAAQAEQTNRSSEAIADAAEQAIETIEDRRLTDATIDAAVEQATEDIGNAKSVDAVRDAVIDGLCGQSSHRNDPACAVRQPDS